MLKKVKLLYIDNQKIVRDFFELALKEKSVEIITLNDLDTFEYNFQEYDPDLVLIDVETFNSSDSALLDSFQAIAKKEPNKFVICGKIELINELQMKFENQFLKPYSPHDLDEQLRVFLKTNEPTEVH